MNVLCDDTTVVRMEGLIRESMFLQKEGICKPGNLLTYGPSGYPTCAKGNRPMSTVLMSTILLDSIYLAFQINEGEEKVKGNRLP